MDQKSEIALLGSKWKFGDEMALEMKVICDKCGRRLDWESDAFICSFECTYCIDCAEALDWMCKECGGELAPRPRRAKSAVPAN